jgi:hypothetical protein
MEMKRSTWGSQSYHKCFCWRNNMITILGDVGESALPLLILVKVIKNQREDLVVMLAGYMALT